MTNERRRTKRVKVGLPVKVSGLDATGKSYEELGHTIDVSPTAIQLTLKNHVRPRDIVTLTLPLPRHMRPSPTAEYVYTCKGVVSRVEEVAGQPGQKSAVVRFVR